MGMGMPMSCLVYRRDREGFERGDLHRGVISGRQERGNCLERDLHWLERKRYAVCVDVDVEMFDLGYRHRDVVTKGMQGSGCMHVGLDRLGL